MLRKFISIENVGKFCSCKPKGDIEFRELNLIYAENARGKTTLCDILRSLKTGEAGYICGRETLGQDDNPSVIIRLDGENATFSEDEWSTTVPDLEIFDSKFVHDNVHAGEFVEHGQKKGLYGVIVGAEGVKLHGQVEALDTTSREIAIQIRTNKAQVQNHVPDGIGIEQFLQLTPTEDLEQRISDLQTTLSVLQKSEEIEAKPQLNKINIPSLPDKLEELLAANIEGMTEGIEQIIQTHIDQHTMSVTKEWLSDGAGSQKGNDCPYCGQETDGIEVVKAYGDYFSDSYKTLHQSVDAMADQVDQIASEAELMRIDQVVERNNALVEFWSDLMDVKQPSIDCKEVQTALMSCKQAAGSLITQKKQSMLTSVTVDKSFSDAKILLNEVRVSVEAYNSACQALNDSITELKEEVKDADATTTRANLDTLLAVQVRFRPEVTKKCQDYLDAVDSKRKTDDDKTAAKDALDNYAGAIFPNFQKSINDILSQFGASFRIRNVTRSFFGGKASSSYLLEINEVPIEPGDSSTPIEVVSFRNTLSAGDRSTLALAFFLAQLELAADLENKIVVLDDPFNSQDSSRRTCTQQRIRRLKDRAKQVFVLSHEASFLRALYDQVPSAEVRTVQLARAGVDETFIAEWDIIEATRTAYFADFSVLLRYKNEGEGEARSVARTIRPVIEGFLRTIFPFRFTDTEWLGDFIKKIEDSDENDPLSNMKPRLEELEDINDYSKRYHHSTNPSADTETVDSTELLGYVKRTLAAVGAPPVLVDPLVDQAN